MTTAMMTTEMKMAVVVGSATLAATADRFAIGGGDGGGECADGIVFEGDEDGWRFEPDDGLQLFTATVVARRDDAMLHIYHASLAASARAFAVRLYGRLGAAAAEEAVVRLGFDASDPLAVAMLSPAMCEMLHQVAACPGSPLAAGLEIYLEQRFGA